MSGLDMGLGHKMQNKELRLIFTAVVLHTRRLYVFTLGEDAAFVTGTHQVKGG